MGNKMLIQIILSFTDKDQENFMYQDKNNLVILKTKYIKRILPITRKNKAIMLFVNVKTYKKHKQKVVVKICNSFLYKKPAM